MTNRDLIKRRFWVVISLLIIVIPMNLAMGANLIKGGIHKDFVRLGFNWLSHTKFQTDHRGSEIKITFNRPYRIGIQKLQSQLPASVRVTSVQTSPKLIIKLRVNKPAAVRAFRVRNSIMVDIVWMDAKKKNHRDKKSNQENQKSITPKKKPKQKKPESKEKLPLETEKKRSPQKTIPLEVIKNDNDIGVYIHIPTQEESKVAFFPMKKDLWLLVDSPIPFSAHYTPFNDRSPIQEITVRSEKSYSLIRLRLSEDWYGKLVATNEGWMLNISQQFDATVAAIEPEVVQNPQGDFELYIAQPDMGDPIPIQLSEMIAPVYVIPIGPEKAGHPTLRRMIDVHIWPSYQGIVFQPQSEDLKMIAHAGSVTLYKAGGLMVSPEADRTAKRAVFQPSTMFDFEKWQPAGKELINHQRNLEYQIVSTPKKKRKLSYLKMIQFLLMTGRDLESLGQLSVMENHFPYLDDFPKYHALKGLAAYLAGRHRIAIEELQHTTLKGDPESRLWENAAKAALGLPNALPTMIKDYEKYLKQYPSFIRNRLVVRAIEEALRQNKPYKALIPLADEKRLTPHQKLTVQYAHAKEMLKINTNNAIHEFHKLSKHVNTPEGVKASLMLASLMVKKKRFKPGEELKHIRKLQYRWKGGPLEFIILKRLAGLYFKNNNFVEGLLCVRQLLKRFPEKAEEENLQKIGEDAFTKAIQDNRGKAPLGSIGLFKEYSDFLPQDERKVEICNLVIDIMIEMDLLDKATQLLQEQIQTPSLDEAMRQTKRHQYAILTLLNQKPKKALSMLLQNDSDLEKKKYLIAQAHLMLHSYKKVNKALEGDNSPDANRLRMQMYLENKNWAALAPVVRSLLGQKPIEERDTRLVMTLAVALFFLQDEEGLTQLKMDYLKLMEDSPQKQAFEILTSNDQTDFWSRKEILEQIENAQKVGTIMDEYRAKIQKEGVSAIS